MYHPLQCIPGGLVRIIVFVLLAALSFWLWKQRKKPLETDAAPKGLCSLEFAGNEEKSRKILESWSAKGVLKDALDSVAVDVFFLLAYLATLTLAVIMAAEGGWGSGSFFYYVGILIAWVQWVTLLLGVMENIILGIVLFGNVEEPWPELAKGCAQGKYILAAVALVYVIGGIIAWFLG